MSAPLDNAAQVLAWERLAKEHLARANDPGVGEDETAALIERAAWVECQIARAPCDSLTVALVKLRTVVRESLVSGCQYHIEQASLVDGIIDYLERQR